MKKSVAWKTLGILLLSSLSAMGAPRVEDVPIPGHVEFVTVARDVLLISTEMDHSSASAAGLLDNATGVPSFSQAQIERLKTRLEADMRAMRALPWRKWSVDEQIDVRWTYANAELFRRALLVEKLYTHRPACWLEPTANNLINLVTYANDRWELQAEVLEKIPAMLAEARTVCTTPTARDVITAKGLIDGMHVLCRGEATHLPTRLREAREKADAALTAYEKELDTLKDLPLYQVVGPENYAWRYEHAMLLDKTPQQLLDFAQKELKRVDARMEALHPKLEVPRPASEETVALARGLTREKLLSYYDDIEVENRAVLEQNNVVTIDHSVGPIRARETPDAMVPLTGDGGSMNPPPPFLPSDVGWWNVEHFHADWSDQKRVDEVVGAKEYRTNGMGPYSAHEGVPGHHLQLSVARHIADPLRNTLVDPVQNEGWALYAEELFWKIGGLGPSPDAEYHTLGSYRARVKRVIWDVQLESRTWTLQQAADFRSELPAGQGKLQPELLRAIEWPTQLICYFAGKHQILRLRQDCRKKWGAKYSARRFHDELLRVGSIPFVFARAKMLGESVPDFPAEF